MLPKLGFGPTDYNQMASGDRMCWAELLNHAVILKQEKYKKSLKIRLELHTDYCLETEVIRYQTDL